MKIYLLRLALRRLRNDSVLSLLNILGLTIGMSCSILIMIWVNNELSFDQFHSKPEQLFRVELDQYKENKFVERSTITQVPMGPELSESFQEIASYSRLRGPQNGSFKMDDKTVMESLMFYADSGFFSTFSFELIQGNPRTALAEPNSIVLTQAVADKVFGERNAMGQIIVYNGAKELVVTGIVAPAPDNSHIKFNGLISFSTFLNDNPCVKWDCNYSFWTYLRMKPNVDIENMEARFPEFLWDRLNKKYDNFAYKELIALRPIETVHLYSKSYEIEPPGNLKMIYLFSAIAVFIIIIACINFINLSTAQLSKRSIEIGIKKVSGASTKQLIWQVFSEMTIQAGMAIILALIVLELTLPVFNNIVGKSLELQYLSPVFVIGTAGVFLVSVLLSGTYPAMMLTSVSPAAVFKRGSNQLANNSKFRGALVVLQFIIAISLIASTAVVYSQLGFISKMDLGFSKSDVLVLTLRNKEARGTYKTLMRDIENMPSVAGAGASTEVPGNGYTQNGYIPEGFANPIMFHALNIDSKYLDVMNMPVTLGRNFDVSPSADKNSFIVNRKLVDDLGWENPIGKIIRRNGVEHPIIGIIEDFQFTSARTEVTALVISKTAFRRDGSDGYNYISIKLATDNLPQSIAKIEQIWKDQIPSLPFEFEFLDQSFDDLYKAERAQGKLFIYFAILAILISSLGVFGLVLSIAEQKTKEIGIRKVLGATARQILFIFSYSFTMKILIATVVSIPITMLLMNSWLDNFAYKTTIQPIHFVLSALLAIIITALTVGFHTFKSAMQKPVDVLKSE